MDPWKPIRLWLGIAVIVAFLAVGGYARLRWGVQEYPYGWTEIPNTQKTIIPFQNQYVLGQATTGASSLWTPRTNNPFRDMHIASGTMEVYDFRETGISCDTMVLEDVGVVVAKPIPPGGTARTAPLPPALGK